jgi:hypothetical protein
MSALDTTTAVTGTRNASRTVMGTAPILPDIMNLRDYLRYAESDSGTTDQANLDAGRIGVTIKRVKEIHAELFPSGVGSPSRLDSIEASLSTIQGLLEDLTHDPLDSPPPNSVVELVRYANANP